MTAIFFHSFLGGCFIELGNLLDLAFGPGNGPPNIRGAEDLPIGLLINPTGSPDRVDSVSSVPLRRSFARFQSRHDAQT
jgi:hypothetical protein